MNYTNIQDINTLIIEINAELGGYLGIFILFSVAIIGLMETTKRFEFGNAIIITFSLLVPLSALLVATKLIDFYVFQLLLFILGISAIYLLIKHYY